MSMTDDLIGLNNNQAINYETSPRLPKYCRTTYAYALKDLALLIK